MILYTKHTLDIRQIYTVYKFPYFINFISQCGDQCCSVQSVTAMRHSLALYCSRSKSNFLETASMNKFLSNWKRVQANSTDMNNRGQISLITKGTFHKKL